MTLHEIRLLLPWFDQATAVRLLAAAQPEAVAARKWQAARAKLGTRSFGAFDTATQPVPRELAARAREFLGATNLAAMPDFPGAELRLVELASLLTFQARISTGGGGAGFLAGYDGSLDSIFTICLPTEARMDPVQVATEGHRATITSDNPNLLFGGFHLNGPALVAAFGFRPPWLQVVEYRGRLIVRNGYHRAWALLHAGARHAFAVMMRVDTLAELGADASGYVSEAHLLSSAPPMVYDFEDSDLYATYTEPAYRRVIRLTAVESMEQLPR